MKAVFLISYNPYIHILLLFQYIVTISTDQSRAYIRVESYVRAGRPLMNAMNITTIFLFTDSQSAIDEAMNCSMEYPDVCQNITFRYSNKTRFYGAEGGMNVTACKLWSINVCRNSSTNIYAPKLYVIILFDRLFNHMCMYLFTFIYIFKIYTTQQVGRIIFPLATPDSSYYNYKQNSPSHNNVI